LAAYAGSAGFTTVYGLAPQGERVVVEWSDGLSSIVAVKEGVFLHSRSDRVRALRFELHSADGQLLAVLDSSAGASLQADSLTPGPIAVR
jgi:hypothetical protein